MRKLLSIILAVVMLAGMMTVAIPASAEVVGKYDTFTAQYESGVDKLYIEDGSDFIAFHNILIKGTNAAPAFVGKEIYLAADVAVNPDWAGPNEKYSYSNTGIVTGGKFGGESSVFYFGGTFDGQGYTLSKVCVATTKADRGGIFGVAANGAKVKNLRVEDSYIASTVADVGTIFSRVFNDAIVEIDNVYSAALVKSGVTGDAYAGGLVGRVIKYNSKVTIRNSVFAGTIYAAEAVKRVGGLVAEIDDACTLTVENCAFLGCINVAKSDTGIAKILGRAENRYEASTEATTVTIKNTIAGGTVTCIEGKGETLIGLLYGTGVTKGVNVNVDNVLVVATRADAPIVVDTVNPWGSGDPAFTNDIENYKTVADVKTAPLNGDADVAGQSYDLTSYFTATPVGPLPTALLGMGEGTAFDGAVSYLGYQVKAVEKGYAIRFIGEGAFDEDIASVGLRVGVEGGNLTGLVSKAATTTKVYGGLVVGAEGGEDDYVAADGKFVYTINVGTFTADMGVITVHVTTLVDGGEGVIACQVKTITIDTAKLPELAG